MPLCSNGWWHYPVGSSEGFGSTYPMDRDLPYLPVKVDLLQPKIWSKKSIKAQGNLFV